MLKKSVLLFKLSIPFVACFTVASQSFAETATPMFVGQPGDDAIVKVFAGSFGVNGDEEILELQMTGQFRHQVQRHEEGFIYKTSEYETDFEFADEQIGAFMTPFVEALGSVETSAVVTTEGDLIALEGLDPVVAAVRESIKPLLEELPEDAQKGLQAMMDSALNEKKLLESAQDDWSYAVGIWNGSELEKGFYYEGEFSEAVEEFGGRAMPFVATYEYIGKVPCNDDDEKYGCIELGFSSTLPEEVSEQLTTAIENQVDQPAPEGFLVSVLTTLYLVAEPDTLRTHYFSKNRTVKTLADDGSGWTEAVERTRYEYFYQ